MHLMQIKIEQSIEKKVKTWLEPEAFSIRVSILY